ncbi:MAG: nucleoside 2-deoxyribosyltransferase [Alphaproteobacteria bacterium]|nr:nucleoside 2-deoxyribosyltransferase [Alphaproteobacteria bacterium]
MTRTNFPIVYLAGPDVFYPEPIEVGRRKKAACERYGLQGLYPLDGAVTGANPKQIAMEIFRQNCRLMDQADAIIANMTPFRGAGMDAGTAFEIGYARAQRKPIFAYSDEENPCDYAERMRRLDLADGDRLIDRDGLTIEDFGLPDNLMMACAVLDSGNKLITRHDVMASGVGSELAIFEACVQRAAAVLTSRR